MRKALLLVLSAAWLLTMAVAPVEAQNLTKADRKQLVQYLKATRNNVQKAIKGLSPAQMSFKSAPERWSVAECLEHIAASEDFLFQNVTDNVMKTPAKPEKFDAAKAHETDNKILKTIPDRSQKAQAPEPLRPTNRYGSPQGSWKHFEESRKRTIDYAKKEPGLRDHAVSSQLFKEMDAYQWVLFLSAHSERHTAQINEVKADPNFPKK